MGRRLDLHHTLKSVFEEATGLKSDKRIWFQSPGSEKLTYPCIIYKLNDMPPIWANNRPYQVEHEYELTVIDRDPKSPLREAVSFLPQCKFVRPFESDGLHHYVFQIYD